MVSHHPAKFVIHRHCGGGDMFLVVEKEDSTFFRKIHQYIYLQTACGSGDILVLVCHVILQDHET